MPQGPLMFFQEQIFSNALRHRQQAIKDLHRLIEISVGGNPRLRPPKL